MKTYIPDLFPKINKKSSPYLFRIIILVSGMALTCVAFLVLVLSRGNRKGKSEESVRILETVRTDNNSETFSVSAVAVPAVETDKRIPVMNVPEENYEYLPAAKAYVYTEDDGDENIGTDEDAKIPGPFSVNDNKEEFDYEERLLLITEENDELVPQIDFGNGLELYQPMLEMKDEDSQLQPDISLPETEIIPQASTENESQPETLFHYMDLKKHDSSEQVTALQNQLMELGYLDIDEPTDYFGSATEAAVKLFQRQHGLPMTGIADVRAQELLYSSKSQKYCLKKGLEGNDVRNIQQQLFELGYLDKKEVDSVYGDRTIDAVKSFQARNHLEEDGIAGEKTVDVLFSDDAIIAYSLYKEQKAAAVSASVAAKRAEKEKMTEPVSKAKNTPKTKNTPLPSPKKDIRIDKFIMAAKSKLGSEYVLGDSGPDTFDCSGFVCWCLRQAGVSVKRLNAAGYSTKSGWKKITEYGQLEKGDILFFKSDKTSHVNHCGIYIGGGMMIDASSGNGKVIKRSVNSYWKRNLVCARRPWN